MEKLFNNFYSWLNKQSEPICRAMIPDWITPNCITYLRVLLSIPVIVFLFSNFQELAIIIFIIASILDYFDGALARAKKEETNWGKFIDPIADKIFVCLIANSVTIYFLNKDSFLSIILFLAILINTLAEIILVILRTKNYREIVKKINKKLDLKATYAGKIKVNLQIFATGFIILSYPQENNYFFLISLTLFALAIPFAFTSIWQKLRKKLN